MKDCKKIDAVQEFAVLERKRPGVSSGRNFTDTTKFPVSDRVPAHIFA